MTNVIMTPIPAKILASMGSQFSAAWVIVEDDDSDFPAVVRQYTDGSWDLYDIGFGCSPRYTTALPFELKRK